MDASHYTPGLYFGMDHDEYLSIPYLSASAMKQILVCPADFYDESWMNPDAKKREPTEAHILGHAYHCILLEPDQFPLRYATKFDKAVAPPDTVWTIPQIQAVLKKHKRPTSGKKPDLIDRLLDADPDYPIGDHIVEAYESQNAGKVFLTDDQFIRIQLAAAHINYHPHLRPYFHDGYPEVVVIWESPEFPGILYKSRLDYLRPGKITDVKTFTNTRVRKIDKAVMDAIVEFKYHIQPAHYLEAARQASAFADLGYVFGDVSDDFLTELAQVKDWEFLWVFQKKEGAPIAKGYTFPQKSWIEGAAKAAIQEATQCYIDHLDRFGDGLWIDDSEITPLTDMDFPERLTEF